MTCVRSLDLYFLAGDWDMRSQWLIDSVGLHCEKVFDALRRVFNPIKNFPYKRCVTKKFIVWATF